MALLLLTKFGTTGLQYPLGHKMKKSLLFIFAIFVCSNAYAYKDTYNPFTGKLDKVGADEATDISASLCSDGQILKKTGGVWACGSDDSSAGGGSIRVSEDGAFIASADTLDFRTGLKASVASGTKLNVSADMATTTTPGIASFDTTNFSIGPSNGGVSIKDDGITLGTETTGGYAASVSEGGPATTATALAANGANCAAGEYPLGVDASGVVESCTDATTEINSIVANYMPLGGGTFTGTITLSADAGEGVNGGGLTDCDTAATSKLLWDSTTNKFSCGTDQGGSGTMNTVKDSGAQVGGTDIVTLDFLDPFTVSESPDTEINLGLDLTAYTGNYGNLTMGNAGAFQTGTTAGNTALIRAYDVDGLTYFTFGTLTAGDTPAFDLNISTTVDGQQICQEDGDNCPASIVSGQVFPMVSEDSVAIVSADTVNYTTGIKATIAAVGNKVTVSGDMATTTSPGIASFDTANFSVGSFGGVSIKTGGVGATELAATSVVAGSYTSTVLTVDADGRITSASTGKNGLPNRDFYWPASATLPLEAADSIPPISKNAGTNLDRLDVLFDSSTDECRTVNFIVPASIDTTRVAEFRVDWSAPCTGCTTPPANNVVWDFRHNGGTAPGGTLDTSLTTLSVTSTADSASADIASAFINEKVSTLGWAVSDDVVIVICRDANNGSDTVSYDASAVGFNVSIPRTE